MDAGVTSFKIEGRTKSIFYVSMVIKAYREVINSLNNEEVTQYWKKELEKLVNRGYTTGFLF